MKARFTLFALLGLGLPLLTVTPAFATDAKDLAGKYTVTGTAPDGTKFEGTAEIVFKQGKTVEITWKIGRRNTIGLGRLDGHDLEVTYQGAVADRHGKATYKVKKNGVLEGTYRTKGEGKGTETLKPVK